MGVTTWFGTLMGVGRRKVELDLNCVVHIFIVSLV